MALARLQSLLTNQSATINSGGASLRSISERLSDVQKTLNNTQVDALFYAALLFRYKARKFAWAYWSALWAQLMPSQIRTKQWENWG